jgi:hypothetical protein
VAVHEVDGVVVFDSSTTPEGQTSRVIEVAVKDHLATLRTIRDSTGTLTGAQLSAAVRALAKGQIHVIRLLVGALDSTD